MRRQSFATLSSVTRDVRNASSLEDPESGFDLSTRNKGLYAYKLPDYDASLQDAAANFEALALPVTLEIDETYQREHPLTEAAKQSRRQADVFSKLKPNQLLLTNLPGELESWMSTPANFREHLLKNVHKDLEVQDIRYVHSITSAAQGIKYAYIVITMGSKRQAHLVEKELRSIWNGDWKLRVKTESDAKTETFDHRTVILRDIPTHVSQRQIIEAFGSEGGAIVGIEMPMENVAMSEYVEKRLADSPLNPDNQEKARKFRLAQLAVKESLEMDQQYQDTIVKELGIDVASTILEGDLTKAQSLIDNERKMALVRLITRLQAEGAYIKNNMRLMTEIRESSSVSSAQSLKHRITKNRPQIEKIMTFLKENNVSAPAVVKTSLDKLLELGQGELAHAYDTLVSALEQREKEIELRIGKQLQHFGMDERILFEKRDYKFELEDLPSEEMYRHSPEEVISINDQINYILKKKQNSAEEKFSLIVNNNLNPFLRPLWNKDQLLFADESLNFPKQIELFDVYDKSMSVMRMMRSGSKFTREAQQKIDTMIEQYKEDFTVPFDELYHREKGLVEAVVAADKALKAKQATFDDLVAKFGLSKHEVTQLTRDSLLAGEHKDLFEQGLDRMEAKVLKSSLQSDTVTGYEFHVSKINKLKQMVDSGELAQSEYDSMIQVAREQEMRNKGYCFITFSHSDEARLLVLQNRNCYIDGRNVQVDLKLNLDHAEMDVDFFYNRLKNDERVTKEVIQLRKARQELREFESQIDDQLPNRRKLKEFRDLARNVIAGSSQTDNKVPNARSDLDEEKLRAKVKEFEKKYPHVDLSQLFNTEKAEDARRSLHKNAFASYKAREFLKHGINQNKEQVDARLSDAKRRLQENDPFNFPELDATVKKVLSKDVLQPKIIDHGEKINRPGRRFNGYTDQEFIEAYFGKDMMRNHIVDRAHDPLFLEQKSLKEMYPVSKYLKMPEENWRRQQIEELGWLPSAQHYDAETKAVYSSDPALAQLQKRMEVAFAEGDLIQNFVHPEDKNRNMLDDIENTLRKYEQKKREEIDEEGVNVYDMKEITKIRNYYAEQYKVDPRKYKKSWMYELKHGRYKDDLIATRQAEEAVPADETEQAKFQTDYDGADKSKGKQAAVEFDPSMDKHTKRVNAEYLYNLRLKPNLENEQDYTKYFKQHAEERNVSFAELATEQAKKAHYAKAGNSYGGKWLKQQESGVEAPTEATKASGPGRSLQSFVDEDDDDIYEMYQRQVNQRPQEEVQVPEPRLDKDLFAPELPRFEEFMNDKAQGIHPFDKITDKVNESLKSMPGITDEEIIQDRDLYQRELLGRLMGEKLTPRQFELLTGQFRSQDVKLKNVKDVQKNRLFDKRQWIQLAQDHAEKIRRQKVIAGEWTEDESHQKLDLWVKELYASNPGPYAQDKFLRDFQYVMDSLQMLDNPERLLEKEYYFDESLGESLNEHCEKLKAQYPGMKVQARRDRDGFAIIKTLYDNAYKYDIARMETWDPEEAQKQQNKALEAVWQAVMPGSPQDVIDNVARQLEQSIPLIQGNGKPTYDVDAQTKLRLQTLVELKANGKIETEEMIEQLFKISAEAQEDLKKPLPQINGTIFDSPVKTVEVDLIGDRERFRAEVYEQLMQRVKKHQFMTQRTKSDFVKPRVSEAQALQGQLKSHENEVAELESQLGGMDATSENFDRKAFNKIKEEIKTRKAAKERLLSQGHAQFKQYLRL